jgi:hypothetical protein
MMREEFVASEKERITEGGDVSSDEGRRGILIIKKDEKQVLSFLSLWLLLSAASCKKQ